MCAYDETCIITNLSIVSSRDAELADKLFFIYRNGPPVAERQILHVQEQLLTDLIDEGKDV